MNFPAIGLPENEILKFHRVGAKVASRFRARPVEFVSMIRRFTEHPATVNETYLQHMGMAFGFGAKMLVGSLGCFVHGIFPWLCLTRGSDTIRNLHHRMVTHRKVQPVASPTATAVAAGD
jgi:hypothetical protein